MSNPIRPYLAQIILSNRLLEFKRNRVERRRKRKALSHLVTVYLAINDPHSYLLLQVLDDFQKRFGVELEFRTVLNKQKEMFPAPELWDKNAFNDGVWLAKLYQLDFPAERPIRPAEDDEQFTAQLLEWEQQPDFIQNALPLFATYWNSDNLDSLTLNANHGRLASNEQQLKENGHYLSGMMHYGGEWYWGLNRLQYLERRLLALGAENSAGNKSADAQVQFNLGQRGFCKQMSASAIKSARKKPSSQNTGDKSLELFWSIRSPYSYVGIVRGRQLAEHYKLPLIIKPVLPMVMRGMQVPSTKSNYIARDLKREADQLGIPFGLIADPLGIGVERCYALVELARSQGKLNQFLESYARGVWSEGIRSETDKGLKVLVERVGLSWADARPLLADDNWREWAQSNQDELFSHELWGVPSFVYGETKVFGQDRLDRVEQAIASDLRL